MSTEQEAIKLIGKLSEESSALDIMAELHFKLKVERGLTDIEEGRLLSQEEVEKKMRIWVVE